MNPEAMMIAATQSSDADNLAVFSAALSLYFFIGFAIMWLGLTHGAQRLAERRGREGTTWALLAFFFSPLVAIGMLLCLKDLAAEKEKAESKRIALETLRYLQELARASRPTAPSDDTVFRIARDGNELGTFSLSQLRDLYQSGQLTLQDHYYDPRAAAWQQLTALL